MIRTARLGIFVRPWKTTLAERSPKSSSPSQIGHQRGNFLGLSEMYLLQMPLHKAIQGEKRAEQSTAADAQLHSFLRRSDTWGG
jgi:hypothetical protein